MSLMDIAFILNLLGLGLVLNFGTPYYGRPPRNWVIGKIGLGMMVVGAVAAAVIHFGRGL